MLLVLPVLLWIVVSLAWLVRLLLLRLLWLLTRMQRPHHGWLARSEPSLDRGTWRPWLVRHRCVVLCVHARGRRPDSDRVAAHHRRWSESVLLAVSLVRHHRSVTSSWWGRVIVMLWVHAGNRLWLLRMFGRRL